MLLVTSGRDTDRIIGCCRNLQKKELRNLYSSPNVNTINRQRRMRCAGHVACMDKQLMQEKGPLRSPRQR
jgi:hypothetical protein